MNTQELNSRKKILLAIKLKVDGKVHPSIDRVLYPYFEWLNKIGLNHSSKRIIEFLTPFGGNDLLANKASGNVIHRMWKKKGYTVVTHKRFHSARLKFKTIIPITNGYACLN